MTDMRARLARAWVEASNAPATGHEWRGLSLATNACLTVRAAVRESDNKPALLLEAQLDAAPPTLLRMNAFGVSLMDQRRLDEGIVRVAVALEKPELRQVFEVLACDVIDVIERQSLPRLAIEAAAQRLSAWQAFLQNRRSGLSREQQIGLIGELIVLEQIAGEIGYLPAILAWQGPLDGLHDFTQSGLAVETKAGLGGSQLVHVSALDQLESRGLTGLAIARPRLREAPTGFVLRERVERIRSALEATPPQARTSFDDLVIRAGFVESSVEDSASVRLLLDDVYGYIISDDFPRILTQTLPSAIVAGHYVLDERQLAQYRIGQDELVTFYRRMRDDA